MWCVLPPAGTAAPVPAAPPPAPGTTPPVHTLKYRKHALSTRGPFTPESYWVDVSFLSNLTSSTASPCAHWYWEPLIGPWEAVITSWSKATWLLFRLIGRDSQRAWHLHCLIKRSASLLIFLLRKWAVCSAGNRAWHWDETCWFMIAFNLKWSLPDKRDTFLHIKKKEVSLFALLGEVMVFFISVKWLFALVFHHSQPTFKEQALRHSMSHSMTDPHKSILYHAKSTFTYRARALRSH